MAKSKEIISFEDFNKELDKISEYGSMLEDSEFARVKDWISTGSYTLNALISGSIFKGVPTGRFTVFSGVSESGKTFLALNTALQAQKKGYNIIWIDTESALDIESVRRFGINTKKFRYEVMSNVTDVITYVKRITTMLKDNKKDKKESPKILFVLDSLGNLSTSKEISDSESGKEKVDMTRAKEIKKMFRVLTTEIGVLQIPFIVINHVYENIGSFIPQNVQSGGCLTKDEKVLMSSNKWKFINNIHIGDFVNTLDGPKEVLETFHFKNKDIIEIELDNGQKIKATPEHKFLVEVNGEERKWKMLKDLNVDDEIILIQNNV